MGDVDPEVHGVGDGQLAFREVVQELDLNLGVRVGEEDVLAVAIRLGDRRRRLLQHAQLREQRLALVGVVEVAPAPGEGPRTGPLLEPLQADVGELLELGAVILGPVAADRGHDADRRVERRRGGEVGARAAEHALRLVRRRVNGVDSDGPGNEQRHEREHSTFFFREVGGLVPPRGGRRAPSGR